MLKVDVEDLWHAVDDPFAGLDEWLAALRHGICTACGSEASQGRLRWWHHNHRLCPDRAVRTPSFSADEPATTRRS